MVDRRDGDEVDLLDASLRTGSGALLSTTLFVLTGVVYAFVTDPAATGRYFFAAIAIALLLRPVRGVSQALQKVGSERGEAVPAYFGLTLLFAVGYLSVVGVATLVGADFVTRTTAFDRALLFPAAVLAVSTTVSVVTDSLFGAVGYPSYQTWLNAAQATLRFGLLFALNPLVSTAGDVMLVVAGTRGVTLLPVLFWLGERPQLPGRHELERTWSFARWSVPDQILDRFAFNMPTLVLGVVASPVAVGVYEAADRFADLGATISWQLSSPLLTRVSGDAAAGDETFAYLDAATTGGTGATFVVLGYLLGAHESVAQLAFPSVQGVFSTTVLAVGGVNLLRGFWTLLSHALEGAGRPDFSFRTKLYGLVCSTPVTAVFGGQYGAVAGAAGYALLNVVVFGLVAYYARETFGRVPWDRPLVFRLTAGLAVAWGVTTGSTAALGAVGVAPTVVAVGGATACLVGFVAFLVVVSSRTRQAARRAYRLGRSRLGVARG